MSMAGELDVEGKFEKLAHKLDQLGHFLIRSCDEESSGSAYHHGIDVYIFDEIRIIWSLFR